jgi:hypothetical protein
MKVWISAWESFTSPSPVRRNPCPFGSYRQGFSVGANSSISAEITVFPSTSWISIAG